MQIATDIKSFFHKKGIHSTTIQPEFTDVKNIFIIQGWAEILDEFLTLKLNILTASKIYNFGLFSEMFTLNPKIKK
jgi:hypothetical protein